MHGPDGDLMDGCTFGVILLFARLLCSLFRFDRRTLFIALTLLLVEGGLTGVALFRERVDVILSFDECRDVDTHIRRAPSQVLDRHFRGINTEQSVPCLALRIKTTFRRRTRGRFLRFLSLLRHRRRRRRR